MTAGASASAGVGGSGEVVPASGGGGGGGGGGGAANDDSGRCSERPNVFASRGTFNCSYACIQGFADCDDSRDNGCETALSEPDACARCGYAFSCLMPELCGSTAVCSNGRVDVATLSRESGLSIELGGFAVDDEGRHVMTVGGVGFEGGTRAIDLSGGVAFRHESGMLDTHVWTSLPSAEGGGPPRVERFGDQLFFFRRAADAIVIANTDLDGAQRWSARLMATASAQARDVILDAEGNVYVWVQGSSGKLTIGDQVFEFASNEDFNLLVSYSPTGALRWVSSRELPDEALSNAIEGWKDIAIVGDRVAVLRRGALGTFSRADGSYEGRLDMDHIFSSYADGNAFMAADQAGNYYIAAVSVAYATEREVPMPDSVPATDPEAEIAERYRAHVTKLDATHAVVWRRDVLWTDLVEKSELIPDVGEPGLHIRSFALTPSGSSWLLGNATFDGALRQFLVGISSEGHIEVARYMNVRQSTQVVRIASDGTPYLAGTYEDWQLGDQLFAGKGVFVEQDLFDALAP